MLFIVTFLKKYYARKIVCAAAASPNPRVLSRQVKACVDDSGYDAEGVKGKVVLERDAQKRYGGNVGMNRLFYHE
ncbi:MAG: hypothetical protein LBG87_01400 [Spirochaetaceae bacterium]|nr:hypothetical protein [Spirochaetaceae bacterium]